MSQESFEPNNKMEIENLAAVEAVASSASDTMTDEEDSSKQTDEDSSSGATQTEPAIDPAADDKSPDAAIEIDPDPMELISQALHHKDEGNNLFKSGDLIKASRAYRKGTSILKPLNQQNAGDEQVKALLISLQTNLSMVCFKQNKYQQSKDVASKVLLVDRLNVKALYRRAVASRKMKNVDAAREDLKAALKADPENRAVKKELFAVRKELESNKKSKQAALAKAFSSQGGSFLYDDKEELEKKRAAKRKEDELKEQDAKEKRKGDWEDACVQRMSKGEDAITFDDYEKDLKVKADEAEKVMDKLKKEKEKSDNADRKARKKVQEAAKEVEESDDSEDELTEKELQMLRGYKKTSDGRTTSYFSREQTEAEKKLLGNIAPQRLAATAAPQRLDSTGALSTASSAKSASVWNNAGTWEEKDTSDWCNSTLKGHLKEAVVEVDHYTGKVEEVEDLSGDASVAFVSGKKRFVFDYHASLTFIILDEGDEKVASGTLKLPDISSTAISDELEVDIMAWKKAPIEETSAAAIKCREALVAQVRTQVLAFVQVFNAQY